MCFWDYPSCPVLVTMCQNMQYPPRFIVSVDGQGATDSVMSRIVFPGAKEFFKRETVSFDVTLTVPLHGK